MHDGVCQIHIVIHDNTDSVLRKLDVYFIPKAESIGEPDIILRSKLKLLYLENYEAMWA